MEKKFTLAKPERLKSRKKIGLLFSEGRRITVPPLLVHFSLQKISDPGISEPLQMGVAVSSRHFKRAPDRNRMKRLIREAWRVQKKELKENLIAARFSMDVFFVYTGKEMADYHLISAKMTIALHKLNSEVGKAGGGK